MKHQNLQLRKFFNVLYHLRFYHLFHFGDVAFQCCCFCFNWRMLIAFYSVFTSFLSRLRRLLIMCFPFGTEWCCFFSQFCGALQMSFKTHSLLLIPNILWFEIFLTVIYSIITLPIFWQFFPSPSYPLRHVQLYDPGVFLQVASAWQLWLASEHSSMSEMIKIF